MRPSRPKVARPTALLVVLVLGATHLGGKSAEAAQEPQERFPLIDAPLFLTSDRGGIPGIPGMGSPLLLKRTAPTGTTSSIVLLNDALVPALATGVSRFEEWVFNEPFAETQILEGDARIGLHVTANVAVSGSLVVTLYRVDTAATFHKLGAASRPFSAGPAAPGKVTVGFPLSGIVLPRNHTVLLQVDPTGLDVVTVLQFGSAEAPSAVERLPRRVLDSDRDGLSDSREADLGTNPSKADTDDDGLPDGEEVDRGTDPLRPDTDGDGESDGDEVASGTDPLDARSNAGRLPFLDEDQDGLGAVLEAWLGTDPKAADTDADGFSDGMEFHVGFDPALTSSKPLDSDADGLPDAQEERLGLDTLTPDTDGDGVGDCWEDVDEDGWANCWELQYGTDPMDPASPRLALTPPDADGDGLLDASEARAGTLADARDSDDDGFWDPVELLYGTDPMDGSSRPRDSDGDGLPDQDEAWAGTDPTVADTDGDGIDDCLEDSDGDGWSNCDEMALGSHPGTAEAATPFSKPVLRDREVAAPKASGRASSWAAPAVFLTAAAVLFAWRRRA